MSYETKTQIINSMDEPQVDGLTETLPSHTLCQVWLS